MNRQDNRFYFTLARTILKKFPDYQVLSYSDGWIIFEKPLPKKQIGPKHRIDIPYALACFIVQKKGANQ